MVMDKLKKVFSEIEKCKNCPLCRKAKNAVPGEGPLNAKIMFIGEAPGREEDKTGRPFIGRSGRLLTKLIEEKSGLKREKVFITSVIKHRPPDNRKPTREEIVACLPYLEEQIKFINPKIIILLGQTAFSAFFLKQKLSDYRGKVAGLNRRKFFITYHPSAGLRFQKMKKILEKDFRKIKNL
jgi:uracil-DNA glycosylase